MDIQIDEVEQKIKSKYVEYKELFSQLSKVTQEISSLEEERTKLIEKDERRFLFRRSVIDLRNFQQYLKKENWISVDYEGFDENKRDDIVDEAMLIDVYCIQSTYLAPVYVVFSLSGYMSLEEYDNLRAKHRFLPEYYRKGIENGER